jgi:ribosomal protein S7
MIKKKKLNNSLHFFIIDRLNFLLLKKGKGSVSKKIIYKLFYDLKFNSNLNNRNIEDFLEKGLSNILLRFVIKYRQKGKVKQQIPVPLKSEEKVYVNTIRFLLNVLKKQKNKSFDSKLIKEFDDIFEGRGQVKKDLVNFNKVVIANRKLID